VCILLSVREEKLQPNHNNLWQIHHSQMMLKRDSYMPCEAMALSTKFPLTHPIMEVCFALGLNVAAVRSNNSAIRFLVQISWAPWSGCPVQFKVPIWLRWKNHQWRNSKYANYWLHTSGYGRDNNHAKGWWQTLVKHCMIQTFSQYFESSCLAETTPNRQQNPS
jgi:hypothetical protein